MTRFEIWIQLFCQYYKSKFSFLPELYPTLDSRLVTTTLVFCWFFFFLIFSFAESTLLTCTIFFVFSHRNFYSEANYLSLEKPDKNLNFVAICTLPHKFHYQNLYKNSCYTLLIIKILRNRFMVAVFAHQKWFLYFYSRTGGLLYCFIIFFLFEY